MASPQAITGRGDPIGADPEVVQLEVREAVRREIEEHWSAPLPPPQTLAEYNAIVPGMAERILVMAEKSITGKIDTADKLAAAEIETAKLGQSIAFALTLIAFAASIVFFALGNNFAGTAFLSVPVVMLIRAFIHRAGSADPGESHSRGGD